MRDLVRLAFNEYRWFQPAVYGRFGEDGRLDPRDTDYSALFAYYDEFQNVTIADSMDRDFLMIFPARGAEFPWIGNISWSTSFPDTMPEEWRDAHLRQVVEVMRLVGAPLGQAGLDEDQRRKNELLIPSPDGFTNQTFTVRDPSEGLAGLFWRNIFGPPFVRMFGDRLLSLPPGTAQDLGDGLVLVQPYELPTQAMTPEGDAAEECLITVLGPGCFYDHQHQSKPTRVPEFTLPAK
ncbi:hypothetical protein [Myxococcus sp. RHSTA-1-4]|uniref:hypothetical protein n=1 Tax=Myxococcus sp. RHSTA-1-4 TaxID=2874601 RepID=UPI001CC0DC5F|nr:hypothetical protein [Myxococcus sp. RHSTA-1-4]MBZ4415521.1 hypothetical protein [Myxococcus sp. RHSTA-1-4]